MQLSKDCWLLSGREKRGRRRKSQDRRCSSDNYGALREISTGKFLTSRQVMRIRQLTQRRPECGSGRALKIMIFM
eukprot:909215-Amorphochlora_amoeboformis.AAC.1